jgi:endonuclease YncB( thermonuclease family)
MGGPPLPLGYVNRATMLDVYDGDTIRVDRIRLGLNMARDPDEGSRWVLVRLAGVAANELRDPGGVEARNNLGGMLPLGANVWLWMSHPDHYGNRVDAWPITDSGVNVCDQLVLDGWALPWDGRAQQPKPVWPRVPRQGVMGYDHAARTWHRPVA